MLLLGCLGRFVSSPTAKKPSGPRKRAKFWGKNFCVPHPFWIISGSGFKNFYELDSDPKSVLGMKTGTGKPGGTSVKDVHWSPALARIPAVESTLTGRQVKTTIPAAHHNAGQVQRGVKQVGQQWALNNYVIAGSRNKLAAGSRWDSARRKHAHRPPGQNHHPPRPPQCWSGTAGRQAGGPAASP